MIDTENKLAWCEHGARIEREFEYRYGDVLSVEIHPDKEASPYGPDFLVGGVTPGDLKTQDTAFRTAGRYGVPPERAVTFNQKDYDRYLSKYPDMLVYFWVRFTPACEVFMFTMADARRLCVPEKLHHYLKRKDDTAGNAKASYVLDTRHMRRVA